MNAYNMGPAISPETISNLFGLGYGIFFAILLLVAYWRRPT